MNSPPLELLPEVLEATLFGLGGAILSLGGTYIEQFAVRTATHGHAALGAWASFIGLLVLFFGYLTLTDTFWPRVVALRQQLRST